MTMLQPNFDASPYASFASTILDSYVHSSQETLVSTVQPPSGHAHDTTVDLTKPDSACISRTVVSLAIRRFLAAGLAAEGFLTAEPDAMFRFEQEVLAFVEQVFGRAKDYAEIANRPGPTAIDMPEACQEYDLDVAELPKEAKKRSRKRKKIIRPHLLELPPHRSPSPQLLASDDEDTPSVIPQTLQSIPHHLPALPPKHTYLRTPAPPPRKQALPTLEKKLENAALVQTSLKNLLTATEDGTDQNDGELFGGVVNWEATRLPRKKWKVG